MKTVHYTLTVRNVRIRTTVTGAGRQRSAWIGNGVTSPIVQDRIISLDNVMLMDSVLY